MDEVEAASNASTALSPLERKQEFFPDKASMHFTLGFSRKAPTNKIKGVRS